MTDSAPTPKASLTVRSGDVPPDDEVIPSQAPATTSTSRSTADDGRVVLAFGGEARLLSPADLREDAVRLARATIEAHEL